MDSKRILIIQRRAKRRLFFMAIVGTAFVGYSALSLFAQDSGASQTTTGKMSSTPGGKAVGIRLINSNANPQSAAIPSSSNSSSTSMPNLLLPPPRTLPPAFDLPPLNKTEGALPLPLPTAGAPSSLPATNFSSLPVPPRMSDVLPTNPSGKVVMKINNGAEEDNRSVSNPQNTGLMPAAPVAIASPANTESVDIRVIQPKLLGEPTALPPLIVEKSSKRVERVEATAMPVPQAGVRLSLGDSGVKESSMPISSGLTKVAESKPRAPQLVKTKATQISHTVVLAQTADLEPSDVAVPEEMDRPVEVEASLVPHSIANAPIQKEKATPEAKKTTGAKVAIKDAVSDPLFDFGAAAGGVIASVVDRSNADARRKFDSRTSSQSVAAVIELESLSATNIDLTGKLLGLAVQDESVCKVIQNDRMVSLVGNQIGSTLVQIWSADLGDKPQVIRVNVTQKKGRVQTGRDDVKDIKQVIAQNFPRAEVNIINLSDGGIEVRGTTESEESAKRILELVRKVYLVPVKDKLSVSR